MLRASGEMKEMCADCPFGHSPKQRHMRTSLKPGRFNEICQSVWQGAYFPCHKTTQFDDEGELLSVAETKMCRGAIEFVEAAARQREDTLARSERKPKSR